MLTLLCPYCGTPSADDFECLDTGQPDTLACENLKCGRRFAYLICECVKCGEESVFTWGELPETSEMRRLTCQHCGAHLYEAEAKT